MNELEERTEIQIPVEFDNEEVNELTEFILEYNHDYKNHMNKVEKHMWGAFESKWSLGEQLWIYENIILDEFEYWKDYAEAIDVHPTLLSRAKNGYEHLRDRGAETWEDVEDLLKQKSIRPTVKNFERIGGLLDAPEETESFEDYTERDQRRLEELYAEAEDILTRNENPNRNEPVADIVTDAEHLSEYLEEIKDKVKRQNPYHIEWRSGTYLDFIRGFGRDLITGEPCERCEAHHTDPNNQTGNYGTKVADWATIPVSQGTHHKITNGEIVPTPEQILKAQTKCLATFLMTAL
ncbi:hypothetical protein ACKGJO_06475 [Gracilimonas sp. Q87]|uniref:hypothetical protein n=1 Tax=Gracilimonas sp. Q87 TaxID=3384766 RepID=UPI003983DCCB